MFLNVATCFLVVLPGFTDCSHTIFDKCCTFIFADIGRAPRMMMMIRAPHLPPHVILIVAVRTRGSLLTEVLILVSVVIVLRDMHIAGPWTILYNAFVHYE